MKKIAAIAMLVAALPMSAQYKMVVNTTDGQKVEFLTSDVESVTYETTEMPVGTLEMEALPEIFPRSGHIMFYDSNDNLVVIGGHTTGFSPSSSAQIYKDGEWTNLNTNYTHDMPFSVILSSGQVMFGGGCSDGSGIGQSRGVEIYDPATMSFTAIANMVSSRTEAHAVELANGNVIVSGNWYSRDGIEMYNAENGTFEDVGGVSFSRNLPHMFETAENQAIIFGGYGNYGSNVEFAGVSVDRLDGTSFTPEVFNTWNPNYTGINFRANDLKIDDYTYIFTAKDKEDNWGIMKLKGEEFSMLETDYPIPSAVPGTDTNIYYTLPVVNKDSKVAYLVGTTSDQYTACVVRIDYSPIFNGGKAKVSFSYKEGLETRFSAECCCITPDGKGIAVSGGIYNSNFSPYSNCYILKP